MDGSVREPDLFGHEPVPFVRHSETSKEAAQAISKHLNRLEALVLDAIRAAGDSGLCNFEIEARLGLSGNTVRPRVVELVDRGLVCDSGKRRNTPSGRRAVAWRTKGDGR